MKSIDFKRKGAAIRVMPDDADKRRSYNWDRIVYFAFLILLFLFLGWYLFDKIFYVKANGQVLFENVNVRLMNDCRVLNYYKNEDDTVAVGDSLFLYVEDIDEDDGGGSGASVATGRDSSSGNNRYDWVEREIYNLRKKIAVNNTEIREQTDLVRTYETEIPKLKNEVILDALPQARLDLRLHDITELKAAVGRINSENNELRKLIAQLTALLPADKKMRVASGTAIAAGAGGSGEDVTEPRVFLAPIEGSVNRIYTRQFETALKQEVVMSIHKNSPIYVRAFFNQEDMEYFMEGDELTVHFPDGSESKGILKRFYYSTVPLPEEFQKRYEPVQRSIAADVYPADSTEQKLWRSFYKMSVEVTKFKY
ncbi:MAG: hypothetical protein FD123_2629 [Bacteroidetes bacterium]|nr:MAG: hypothetical protein FD123_2629 [Bacteroidota bacterium]